MVGAGSRILGISSALDSSGPITITFFLGYDDSIPEYFSTGVTINIFNVCLFLKVDTIVFRIFRFPRNTSYELIRQVVLFSHYLSWHSSDQGSSRRNSSRQRLESISCAS